MVGCGEEVGLGFGLELELDGLGCGRDCGENELLFELFDLDEDELGITGAGGI